MYNRAPASSPARARRNVLLLAAGCAPRYTETAPGDAMAALPRMKKLDIATLRGACEGAA